MKKDVYIRDERAQIPSYGAVVIEEASKGHVVLLCTGFRGMSFPKGHIEEGETPVQTASREVLEETGISVTIDESFSRTVKSPVAGDDRSVTFYIGRSTCGTAEPTPQASEVKRAEWTPVREALDAIVFDPDRQVLLDALKHLGIRY